MTNEEVNIRINKKFEEDNKMENGIVNWFNAEKGFGFIERENGNGDLFVHFQNIDMDGYKTLEKGQNVEFEIEKTEKGEQAIHVRVIEE